MDINKQYSYINGRLIADGDIYWQKITVLIAINVGLIGLLAAKSPSASPEALLFITPLGCVLNVAWLFVLKRQVAWVDYWKGCLRSLELLGKYEIDVQTEGDNYGKRVNRYGNYKDVACWLPILFFFLWLFFFAFNLRPPIVDQIPINIDGYQITYNLNHEIVLPKKIYLNVKNDSEITGKIWLRAAMISAQKDAGSVCLMNVINSPLEAADTLRGNSSINYAFQLDRQPEVTNAQRNSLFLVSHLTYQNPYLAGIRFPHFLITDRKIYNYSPEDKIWAEMKSANSVWRDHFNVWNAMVESWTFNMPYCEDVKTEK